MTSKPNDVSDFSEALLDYVFNELESYKLNLRNELQEDLSELFLDFSKEFTEKLKTYLTEFSRQQEEKAKITLEKQQNRNATIQGVGITVLTALAMGFWNCALPYIVETKVNAKVLEEMRAFEAKQATLQTPPSTQPTPQTPAKTIQKKAAA